MQRLSTALLFVVAAGYAGSVAAQPPGGPEARHRGGPLLERILERHADRLKLDETTRERIRAITAAARDDGRRSVNELRESRGEMRRLLTAEDPDENAVMRQAEKIGRLETEVQKHRLRTMLRIRALLTPEQRRELVKIHEERRARRERRMERRNPEDAAKQRPPAGNGERGDPSNP